jgi:uncharacterized protein YcnI
MSARRLTVTVTTALVLVIALAAPAWAHITVNADKPVKGGFTKLAFRVPSERDDSPTVKVEIAFPIDHPLAFVSVKPLPGWTYTVEKTKLDKPIKSDDGEVTEAVSRIVWQGGEIKAGEFQEFEVSAGPLPTDTDSLTFKALQTYADGQVVRWIEEQTGSTEPDNPAPVLKLVSADGSASATTTTQAASEGAGANDDDGDSDGLAIAALVVAVVAVGLGGYAVLARRRS